MPETPAGPQCFNCGAAIADAQLPIARHSTCPQCYHELHCCRMCRQYRPTESTTCAEDRADVPTIKDNANFCEWFVLNGSVTGGDGQTVNVRQELDSLFDDKPSDAASGPTLDDLFS